MKITFIHTADWQIGKPFHGVEDSDKRALLRNERVDSIRRFAAIITQHKAEFILVAGDLFDSPTPTNSNVSAILGAIGNLEIPVYVISGNHDFAGPGSLWEQDFFKNEKNRLAPNLHMLLNNEPVILDKAILFPCPLMRRHESSDLTAWLRNIDFNQIPDNNARIVLAHGSVLDFQGTKDEDEASELASTNYIDINKLPLDQFDFVALGDWHGTKKINSKTWYAGTHEADRFGKGEDYNPGNILIVKTERGMETPDVIVHKTGRIKWIETEKHISEASLLDNLEDEISINFENRMDIGLLKLNLTGSLGLQAQNALQDLIERFSARLIRLKLSNKIKVDPTQEELNSLVEKNNNPLISAVANSLFVKMQNENVEAEMATIALKELYLTLRNHNAL
jgi:DNA repair exonuclease SbcCD nuclease subunit